MKKIISGLEDRAEEIIEEATGREKQEEMEKKISLQNMENRLWFQK